MSDTQEQARPTSLRFVFLERITSLVLLLVVAALGWILFAAYQPATPDGAAEEVQAILIIGLLSAALVLVSVVALLHTR